ncbi:unnamed protein product [Diatraea saccharalis]|uniref:Vacuolar protein sorting-associated protein 26C n=1 Tax=Diatraea saccharalis TaxID=40085 RepID=A0A9P0BY55_9NEOP|nr:unnamed protein product [Diatraea saccharalis]
MSTNIDISLKRASKVYFEGETIAGVVVVESSGDVRHEGMTLLMEGVVNLQLSTKNVGIFEAFSNSIKPINLLNTSLELVPPGKIPVGITDIPFEIPLRARQAVSSGYPGLLETYHGVFVNIMYTLKCSMKRSFLNKPLNTSCQFFVQYRPIRVDECTVPIKSIELQLVRVETCGCAEGYSRDATEIQNIQVGEGDVARGRDVPLYMVLPRLFTCPTVTTTNFKIGTLVELSTFCYTLCK